MAVMRSVGNGHPLPSHAHVREEPSEYLIELDVADFTESELAVELLGQQLTVRADQLETTEDEGKAFRMRESLEASFRLPDDANADRVNVLFKHGTLEIHAARTNLRRKRLAIERPSYLINPNAEAC